MANTATASATSTGAPTARRSRSTSTASSTSARKTCPRTPLSLKSAASPTSSPRSRTSRSTSSSASAPTATPPRAPTPASSGGTSSSLASSSASRCSRSGGCGASSRSSASFDPSLAFFVAQEQDRGGRSAAVSLMHQAVLRQSHIWRNGQGLGKLDDGGWALPPKKARWSCVNVVIEPRSVSVVNRKQDTIGDTIVTDTSINFRLKKRSTWLVYPQVDAHTCKVVF
ncbi:hypothetical protein TPAR_00279 [Tolypocladium paradoxum]|uniref:Uncharacterized protein n=1 Tax=Tolypocladium paradoxum TaxID=94208 RepID=A0A2S4LAQ9_9HYPO|nr:hypothetical protein TPAR_00279 [Tolypocladium paradoxum]